MDLLSKSIGKYGYESITYHHICKGNLFFTECKVSRNNDDILTITAIASANKISKSSKQASLLVLQQLSLRNNLQQINQDIIHELVRKMDDQTLISFLLTNRDNHKLLTNYKENVNRHIKQSHNDRDNRLKRQQRFGHLDYELPYPRYQEQTIFDEERRKYLDDELDEYMNEYY